MELAELITGLCSLSAPSGFEEPAREAISKRIAPYTDEQKSDPMGNLIALRRCGKRGAPKLVINAHMDEIGLIVTAYNKGFLCFHSIGGVDRRMLPAMRVKLLTEPPIFGVIDVMPPHALTGEEMDKSISPDKLFIDCGFSEDEAKKMIPLGTPVVFGGTCERFSENIICGKSLDDRACAAIIIKVMEALSGKELNCDVYALISTQEELGFRGATTGVFSIDPDYAIAIDVTHAYTPDADKEGSINMGSGAAISVGPNMTRSFTNGIKAYADKNSIKYNIEVEPGRSGTDAWVMQVSRGGVATALVSLPIKYMHSPVEMMDLRDAQAICDLLSGFIAEFEGEVKTDDRNTEDIMLTIRRFLR